MAQETHTSAPRSSKIDINPGDAPLFTREESVELFGVEADVLSAFKIGECSFAVMDASGAHKSQDGKSLKPFGHYAPAIPVDNPTIIVQIDNKFVPDQDRFKLLGNDSEVTLGRQHSTDTFFYDSTVSRAHVSVKKTETGLVTIEDLGSTNRTLLYSKEDLMMLRLSKLAEEEVVAKKGGVIAALVLKATGDVRRVTDEASQDVQPAKISEMNGADQRTRALAEVQEQLDSLYSQLTDDQRVAVGRFVRHSESIEIARKLKNDVLAKAEAGYRAESLSGMPNEIHEIADAILELHKSRSALDNR